MNIYVGNLAFSTTEDELHKLFEDFGEVQTAKVIMDRDTGRSRGFGFVEMPQESARKAIESLNGVEFGGKELTVNEAREKKQFGGGGGGGRDGNQRFNRRSW